MQGNSKSGYESGGSGIGLAICKEIVTAHNGAIWSENKKEGGARIVFIIPG